MRPVPGFVAVALGLGWTLLSLPLLAARGLLPFAPPLPVLVLAVTYGVLVPAALLLTWRADGTDGVQQLLRRAVSGRFRPRWWVVIVAGIPVLSLVLGVLLGGRVEVGPAMDSLAVDLVNLATALLLVQLAEELVWAGFVQTRLAARFGVFRGALLTALPFAALHLPLTLAGAYSPAAVVVGIGGLLLLAALLRVAIGLVLDSLAGSVLAAAVLHASFNAANNSGSIVDDALGGVDQGLAAVLALALLSLALAARQLSRRPRRQRDSTGAEIVHSTPPTPGSSQGDHR